MHTFVHCSMALSNAIRWHKHGRAFWPCRPFNVLYENQRKITLHFVVLFRLQSVSIIIGCADHVRIRRIEIHIFRWIFHVWFDCHNTGWIITYRSGLCSMHRKTAFINDVFEKWVIKNKCVDFVSDTLFAITTVRRMYSKATNELATGPLSVFCVWITANRLKKSTPLPFTV